MASFGLQRPRTASMASFGFFGLIPASMAFWLLTTSFVLNSLVWPHSVSMALSFGLNGLILASMASYSLIWPLRPRSASTALPRPPWPRMASMASFGLVQPQRPRVAFMALIRPPRPHYSLRGPTRPSWPQFGRHGLNLASTASLRSSWSHSAFMASIRPLRCHYSFRDLTWPQFGLNGLTSVSVTSLGLHSLNLASTASLWSL